MEAKRITRSTKSARQFVSLLRTKAQRPWTTFLELSSAPVIFFLGFTWGQSAAASDRSARWPDINDRCSNPTEAARAVLRSMLYQDVLNKGQKADLGFVLEVLDKNGHSGEHAEEVAAIKRLKTSELDDITKDYIKGFMGVNTSKKSLREVVKGIMFIDRLRSKSGHTRKTQRQAVLKEDWTDETQQELSKLGSYTWFDIFALGQTTKHPLEVVTVATLHERNLLDTFGIQLETLHNFLGAIEGQYSATPYHNSLHAADVVQSTHALLRGDLDAQISELEVLTLIFAAACHDVAHPGVTNQFRVGRRDEGAIVYNDMSVNEMMHCSTAYRVLHTEGSNFLERLSREQESSVRKTMIECVLATDMANHFKNLKDFNDHVDARGREVSNWDSTSVVLEIVLHSADISNVTKAHDVAVQWADLVLKEFFLQGDRERDLRVPISPLCDRHSVSKAKSQVGFVDFVVKPQFSALGRICNLDHAMEAMNNYTAYWKEVLEKEATAENKPAAGHRL